MIRQTTRGHIAVIVALLAGSGVGGCGVEEYPEPTPEVTYTLPATTRYISTDNEHAVLGVDNAGATIVLDPSSALADVAEGDVLMFGITSRTPEGLLRKVTSRADAAEGVRLATEEATLEEAFQELELDLERPISDSDASTSSFDSQLQGLSMTRHALTIKGGASGTFTLNFDNTVLYDRDGNKSTRDDQVVADGSLSFSVGVNFKVKISWFKLKRLKVGAKVSQSGELKITARDGLKFNKQVVLGKLRFGAFAVGPVVIRPTVELMLGASGDLKAKVSTAMTETVWAEAGAEYSGGKWNPYASKGAQWTFQPPAPTAAVRVKAFLGPRLSLKLYGVAGPYAQAAAYVELNAGAGPQPAWQLYAGIEASLGIQGSIFGKKLLNFKLANLVDYRKLLSCGPEANCAQTADQGGSSTKDAAGTWTDPATGLTWQVTPTGDQLFMSADTHCKGLTLAGGGWRAPTITELQSLIRGCTKTSTGKDTLSLGCAKDAGPASGCYWPAALKGTCGTYFSSTKGDVDYRWVVNFNTGGVENYGVTNGYARCVR